MKVMLISANRLVEPYPVYPLGLDYVAGAIAPPHLVRIVDMNQIPDMNTLAYQIRSFGPDLVGISLRNVDNTDVLNPRGFMQEYAGLMQAIRSTTSALTVLGGSGFTIFPAEAMQILQADFGIIGEGERLRLLLDALACGNDPGQIEGVLTRGGPVRPAQPWPYPTVRRFDPQAAHLPFYLQHSGMLNLHTKRGCPFHCVYCTYPSIEGHRMRLIDPDEIARTAAQLQDAGAKYLFITDSAFNADMDHSLAVARAFQRNGISLPWGAFFAPVRCAPDYFNVVAECGLRHVEFGTESLSDPVLAAYGKPFRKQEVRKAHALARAAGLHVAHYFLFGGPGESVDTLEETLDAMEKLDRCVLFLFCGMRIYPHTALHDLAVAQGRIEAGQCLTEPVYYQSAELNGPAMLETIKAHAGERINWVLGAGGAEMSAIMSRMYQKGYSGPLWEYLCR